MTRYTPEQAAAAFARFEKELPKIVLGLALEGMRPIHKAAITKHMIPGGGKHAPVHPTKLTWRSGKLARSVRIIKPKLGGGSTWAIQTGLAAGGPGVPYAGHETGIRGIRPRPYMRPAITDGWEQFRLFIDAGIAAFAQRTL